MNKNSATPGTLYVVATPIGNLGDISQRAIQILQTVDAILAEDTRHSGQLLSALGIKKPLISLHAHNEHQKTNQMITALQQEHSYALISDAGTPLIRDPGFSLVRAAQEHHLKVVPIPGPCALITALSAAGVPCDTFTFAGFLETKQHARINQLKQYRTQGLTVIFYESTHRITECIIDIANVYGSDYRFVLAKELTKLHEHFIQGTAAEIEAWLNMDKNHSKGEFVILLPPLPELNSQDQNRAMLSILLRELPLKQAVKIAAELSSTHKNELYSLALAIKDGE